MKNSYDLERELDVKYQNILDHDKVEIDNPDKYHRRRLHYLDRLRTIVSIITKMFPVPDQIKIGDFGCAQGNVSLILAELGYRVFAIDINPTFIEYSKIKYEKGQIEWIVGDIQSLDFPLNMLDVAIAGELIEHCAYPEEIVEKILKYVRPGGFLILTTPNGSRIRTNLPTFEQFISKTSRKVFEERQFGPDDEDHLFLFRLNEIEHIMPKESKIIEKGYLGGTILINKYSQPFLRLFPVQLVEKGVRMLSRVPVVNAKTFNNLYVILRKDVSVGSED